jgi:hypothetical protein
MTKDEKKELESLLTELTEGELSSEQSRRLEDLVREHPSAKEMYLEYCQVHTMLAWEHGVLGGLQLPDFSSTPEIPSGSFRSWKPLAMAAALVLTGMVLWSPWGTPSKRKPGEPVATLENSPGAEMRLFRRDVDLNDSVLRAGDYTLSAGLVSIRYETGVALLIEAPASFSLDSKQSVRLDAGQIAANVPPEGVGFTIETPSAEVIDYGTEFAVGVGEDGASEVHVFQGEVEVLPRGEEAEPVRLFTNAATRVEKASSVPMGIAMDESRFLRSLDEPPLRHSRLVQNLGPSLYFRMGVPTDGMTMRDKAGEADGKIVDRGAKRPPFSPGKVGSSVRFDGPSEGAYLHVPDFPKPKSGQLSLSCWIKAESLPRRGTITSNTSLHREGIFEAGLKRDSGKVFVGVKPEGSDDLVEVSSTDSLPLHSWQHFAFVADGETLRLFLNGIEIASTECGPVSVTDSHPFLGIGARMNARKKTADQFWHGRIDEFALFNHALSDADVLTLYQNSDPVKK